MNGLSRSSRQATVVRYLGPSERRAVSARRGDTTTTIEASRSRRLEPRSRLLASVSSVLWEGNVASCLQRRRPAGALSERSSRRLDRQVARGWREAIGRPDTVIAYEQRLSGQHHLFIRSPRPNRSFGKDDIGARSRGLNQDDYSLIHLGETHRAMSDQGRSAAWRSIRLVTSVRGFGSSVSRLLSAASTIFVFAVSDHPFRRITALGGGYRIITAFHLGHSVTLIGTAYNMALPGGLWFRRYPKRRQSAASIFYMAIREHHRANLSQRWISRAVIGLVCTGFGFADALKEQLQFAGSHLDGLSPACSFNGGIEMDQTRVLCVFVPDLALLFRGPHGQGMRISYCPRSFAMLRGAGDDASAASVLLLADPVAANSPSGCHALARWVVRLRSPFGAANFLPTGREQAGKESAAGRSRSNRCISPYSVLVDPCALNAIDRPRARLAKKTVGSSLFGCGGRRGMPCRMYAGLLGARSQPRVAEASNSRKPAIVE